MVRGLQNRMLQTDILTIASQLKTLADLVKYAQSIEAAIRDHSHLENKHPVETAFATHQSVYQRQKNSNLSIERIFRELFITFGIPDELRTDGDHQFTANSFKTFLNIWRLQHRKSSVEYPQSNGSVEVAVKSAKCIIYDNTGTNNSLGNDKAAVAILQYHDTLLQDCNLSPAQILFH